jgi:hypothetical protein
MVKSVRIVIAAALVGLGGCSTSLKYSTYTDGDTLSAKAFRFSLPDTKVTLSNPGGASQNTGAAGGGSAPKSNCDASAADATWWTCFNGASASVAMSPPPATATVYVASPADDANLRFVTTTVSGTAVSGQDTLYSSITVKYQSNTASILNAAGTGATSAGAIFGPYGFVLGGLAGGVGGALGNPGAAAVGTGGPSVDAYLCKGDPVSYGAAPPKMSLYLPAVLGADQLRNGDQFRHLMPAEKEATIAKTSDDPEACWNSLPNAGHLADAPVNVIGAAAPSTARAAIDGDGWLYRVVAVDNAAALSAGPKSAVKRSDYFSEKGARHDFPYTVCRKAHLQLTWWKELSDAVNGSSATGKPKIVSYDIVLADPAYLMKADVTKGAVINFRADCGATVATTPDTSNAAIINAIVSNTESIYKSEQTWQAAHVKK